MTAPGNLFADRPLDRTSEHVQNLATAPGVRIERIISHGHHSRDGFWYDQDDDEWVLVVRGAARLRFEDGPVELGPGDHLMIPARKRHRVEWTTPDGPTIWLVVFFRTEPRDHGPAGQ